MIIAEIQASQWAYEAVENAFLFPKPERISCILCGDSHPKDDMHGNVCPDCNFDKTDREHLYDQRIDDNLARIIP